jgi:hypothetical protein
MSSVPVIQFTPAGVVLPTEAAILAGVQADINTAFGGGANPALATPQGQLASSEAAIIADKNSAIAFVSNAVNPQFATGRWQDAIGNLIPITRNPATSTVVACTLVGTSGTVIPAGTLARDTEGNTYSLLATVTIPSGGTFTGSSWANIETGPIPCPATTLVQVYQAISGWDTISNPVDGALGQNVESPSEFEFRRQNSVAANSRGTVASILAAVFAVANVLDCFVIDNPSGNAVNYGATNYPLAPHSIFVAVLGGIAQSIAEAIWSKKDGGCGYNGNTNVTVTDDNGYSFPQPTYNVQFEIPNALSILFAIQIVNDPTLPSNIVEEVQSAVIARFNGTDGTTRERIGSTVLAARYYSAIAGIASNVTLLSVLIGTSSANAATVPVGIDQFPSLSSSNIEVTLV